jgi:hypothetical protein
MSSPSTPVRQSPEVAQKINYSPFINFRGPSAHSLGFPTNSPLSQPEPHSSLDSGTLADPSRPARMWTQLNRNGHGSRHVYDKFPFSLWVEEDHDYRSATTEEVNLILETYKATTMYVGTPFIVVVTDTPPRQVPLTIGCAPAYFISHQTDKSGWRPGIPLGNKDYANPRVANPFPECIRRRWQHPLASDVEIIANKLLDICNVESLVFSYPFLTVVIRNDGRSYEKRSLPGRVGYWSTTYYHGEAGLWNQYPLAAENRNREMTPDCNAGIEDTFNYLTSGGFLCPGVRVTGLTMSSSCGVQVKNKSGAIRVTCANHGFQDGVDVYHPDRTQNPMGKIKERYEDEDVALFELDKNLLFRNNSYFDAAEPKRLLTGGELRELNGTWFEADGMSTGLVSFMSLVIRHDIPPRRPEDYRPIPYTQFTTNLVWNTVGVVGTKQLANGICGAPIVQCPDVDGKDIGLGGGVAGFFQIYHGGGFCASPTLDKLIMDGWELH